MRCFTDAEIRRGVVAVRLAHPEADLMDAFLLAAETPDRTTTDTTDQSRGHRVDNAESEPTRRGSR
jgi:hypothetical protein